MKPTGTLRNARRVKPGDDPRAPCLSGEIYGDTKGRFRDGERITTSTIESEDGDLFVTRYSIYKVESWADETATVTMYDPPSGWKYGFPKPYAPLEGEDIDATLLRDGYPQAEINRGMSKYCRFWEERA